MRINFPVLSRHNELRGLKNNRLRYRYRSNTCKSGSSGILPLRATWAFCIVLYLRPWPCCALGSVWSWFLLRSSGFVSSLSRGDRRLASLRFSRMNLLIRPHRVATMSGTRGSLMGFRPPLNRVSMMPRRVNAQRSELWDTDA